MVDLNEIYAQTRTLRHLLERLAGGENALLKEQILPLLRTRGVLIRKLERPCSEDQRMLAEQIVAENYYVDQLLKEAEAKLIGEIGSFRERKHTLTRYQNPYANLKKNSVFMDKRE
ncbi:MAG: hypothetical protein ABF586_09950 [Sporolactobacillus sp.]